MSQLEKLRQVIRNDIIDLVHTKGQVDTRQAISDMARKHNTSKQRISGIISGCVCKTKDFQVHSDYPKSYLYI